MVQVVVAGGGAGGGAGTHQDFILDLRQKVQVLVVTVTL